MILNPAGYLFYDEIIIPLLRKYSSNALFIIFLYPLINQKTLLEIKDDNIFTIIYEYLKDICNVAPFSIKSLNSLVYDADKDGYILYRLFAWPRSSVPLSTPESISFSEDNLKNYLKKKFNWEWIDKSKITPNYEQNWIDIFKPNNAEEVIRLSIEEEKNKSILTMNDENMDEFIITINESFLSINIKTKEKKEDMFLQRLKDDCKSYQSSFLLNLRNQSNSNPDSFKLLSQDENFIKSLKNIKINIKDD